MAKINKIFKYFCIFSAIFGIIMLLVLLIDVFSTGIRWLSLDFLMNFPSRFPERAGIKSALIGSVLMMLLVALISLPLGIGAAIYLEEYAEDDLLKKIIEVNIANLAGVPSIVYGILGLALFVRMLNFGRSLIAGALTLSLLILPIIIVASQEAIRAVPRSMREASYALGATKWQTTRHHVLPYALPGILTGAILALSRAIGETAPLIMIGALTYVAFIPKSVFDPFTVLPIQIFNWVSLPRREFHELAAAGIIVLLFLLLTMNSIAIWLRNKYTIRW